MPVHSRWMIRCALIYMILGFVIGGLLLVIKAYPVYPAVWALLAVHIEVSIFGWIIQLTMGTAYWMLPRFIKGEPRGPAILSKAMVATFNSGILLNVFTYLGYLPEGATLVGRSMEVLAVLLFIALHWGRAVSYNT